MVIESCCIQSMEFVRNSFSDAMSNVEWPDLYKTIQKIRNVNGKFEERVAEAELLISYPHSKLDFAFQTIQQFLGKLE